MLKYKPLKNEFKNTQVGKTTSMLKINHIFKQWEG